MTFVLAGSWNICFSSFLRNAKCPQSNSHSSSSSLLYLAELDQSHLGIAWGLGDLYYNLPVTIVTMGNDATQVNPNVVNGRHVDIAITYRGSDLYFAICAAMGATTLAIIAASAMKPRSDRIFFYITAGVTGTATLAYFTMGSNLGWVPIDVEWLRSKSTVAGRNREIFYARYIDW